VIATCPACQVNYRLGGVALMARTGRCSRCETEFPLPTRSSYRLVPAVVGGADLLAEGAKAATEWPDMPPISPSKAKRVEAAAVPVEPQTPVVSERSVLSGIVQGIVASVLAGGGAAAGYYLSLNQGADFISWTAAGSAAGLTLAWVAIRWTRRKR